MPFFIITRTIHIICILKIFRDPCRPSRLSYTKLGLHIENYPAMLLKYIYVCVCVCACVCVCDMIWEKQADVKKIQNWDILTVLFNSTMALV